MQYLLIFLTVFLVTVGLTWLAIKCFPRIGLIDNPLKYGLKRAPIPYGGGLIIFFVFVVFSFIFLQVSLPFLGVLVGATVLVVVSFLDYRLNISPGIRLLIQLLVALMITFFGIEIDFLRSPFGGGIFLNSYIIPVHIGSFIYNFALFSAILTILWIIGMMNTVNWMDGVNGMSVGISFIAFMVIFFLSIRSGVHHIDQTQVTIMSLILAAGTLAFLLFEFYPAKILMGDTGTMFLGFMIGVLAIFSGGKVATAFLVMGFPILDAIWVFFRRIWQRKSPMKGDLHHFYHRLLEIGFSPKQSLLIVYMLCFSFGMIALLLDDSYTKALAILVMILVMIFIAFAVVKKEKGK